MSNSRWILLLRFPDIQICYAKPLCRCNPDTLCYRCCMAILLGGVSYISWPFVYLPYSYYDRWSNLLAGIFFVIESTTFGLVVLLEVKVLRLSALGLVNIPIPNTLGLVMWSLPPTFWEFEFDKVDFWRFKCVLTFAFLASIYGVFAGKLNKNTTITIIEPI